MSLKKRINDDLKAALLSGNRFVVDVLRGLKAAILNAEVASNQRETGLEDSEIEKIIAKEVKKRKESAQIYKDAGRNELCDNENEEANVLLKYLPEQLSEDEILAVVNQVISELKATDLSQMGKVIGATKARLGSSADGSVISNIVKKVLN